MTIIELLEKWFHFSDYDPHQHKFNLLDNSYYVHDASKRILDLIENYDPTGILAVIYAKTVIENVLKDVRFTALELVTGKKELDGYQELWDAFNSKEVLEYEKHHVDAVHSLMSSITGTPLIGERDIEQEKKIMAQAIYSIATSISKLNVDIYLKGGEILPIKNFSTKIQAFSTLAQCVTSLEFALDGMYLCYISLGDSADGYFGYFIKSNGNLFSLNERPDEAYIGQHMRSRNGRWAESKAYEIFPYETAFTFGKHDYKGYAMEHIINAPEIELKDLSYDEFYPIVTTMMLISNKYQNKTLSGELVLFTSLLEKNLSQLPSDTPHALVPVSTSTIAVSNSNLNLPFSTKEVLSGCLHEKYDWDTAGDGPKGHFNPQVEGSFTQTLISLYGDDFELDEDAILKSDTCLMMHPLLLETSSNGESQNGAKRAVDVEFVGTAARIELEAYRQAREQLAAHIKEKMYADHIACGGTVAMHRWWKKQLIANEELIREICIKAYIESDVANKTPADFGYTEKENQKWSRDVYAYIPIEGPFSIGCYPNTNRQEPYNGLIHYGVTLAKDPMAPFDWRTGERRCPVNGTVCNLYFSFGNIQGKEAIEYFAKEPLPNSVKLWTVKSPSSGNHLLNATDAVARLYVPSEYHGAEHYADQFRPDFLIGFSKSGFNQLVKEYKAKHNL